METLYVVSTEPSSGKSGIALCLALKLQEKGMRVGFMKPVSTLPARIEGASVDEDAYYMWKALKCEYSLKSVSPIILSSQFIQESLQRTEQQRSKLILGYFAEISKDKDIVILEGAGDLRQGRFVEASAPQLAVLLDAKVLLIAKAQSDFMIDEIITGKDIVKERLVGVIFNFAPRSYIETLETLITPVLDRQGIKVFGVIPEDKLLRAVTVGEIAEHLGGEILCAAEKVEELVEEFMVGAMSQEHALRYFRRTPNKAVITGGDRSDVQLAALETPTKCLILTGNFQPSPIVLARAEELGIPMILVDVDTYTAVDRMEALIGRVGLHEKKKIEQMRKLLSTHIHMRDLFASIGLSEE